MCRCEKVVFRSAKDDFAAWPRYVSEDRHRGPQDGILCPVVVSGNWGGTIRASALA